MGLESTPESSVSFASKFRETHPFFSIFFFCLIMLMAVLFVAMAGILIYEHCCNKSSYPKELEAQF